MYYLIHSVGDWSAGFACLGRLQAYLNLPETEDAREFAVQNDATVEEKNDIEIATPEPSVVKAQAGGVMLPSRGAFVVQLHQVSLSAEAIIILKEVSLNIKTGHTAMVFGPVGCGKTTLLRAILGEVKPTSGTVTLATCSVAYCSQVPWVQNETIQSNILGGRPLNVALYNEVIHVCALDVDIARLSAQDQTLAGSEGCNLSGGQKQRVSLARALYVQADLVILDDVFSALDTKTSAAIRSRLFSESDLLRSGKTTVIMATSMQGHLVHADVSYEMANDGTAALSSRHEQVRKAASASPDQPVDAVDVTSAAASASTGESDHDKEPTWEPPEVVAAPYSALRQSLSTLRYGDWTIYEYFLRHVSFLNVIAWLFTVACASVADRMPPIFARIWLGKAPQNRLYFIGYALLGFLSPCLYYCTPLVYYKLIITNCTPGLHRELLDATSQATFEFLAAEDAGTLLNRFSQDVQMATQQLPVAISPVVWGLCSMIIDVGVIAAGATYALPIIPFFLVVVGLIAHFYLRTSRQVRLAELDSTKSLIRHLTESASGIEYIRAFQWEQNFIAQLHHMLHETQKPYYCLLAIQQWLTVVMDFTTAGSAVCVVSLALNFKSSTSASAMGLALLTLISFSDFTGSSVRWFVQMENMFGAVARIREFAQSTPRESDDGASDVPKRWPVSGKVEFDGVSASYK